MLLRLAAPAKCLAETVPQPAHYPAAAGWLRVPGSLHTVGMGKDTAPVVAAVVVPEPVLPFAVAAVAVRSWLPQPGTTVPTLPN